MRIFIQALDYDLWSVIINGSHTPTVVINGIPTPKLEKDWDDSDKKLVQLNSKAMNILYCALDAKSSTGFPPALQQRKFGIDLK